MAPLSIRLDAYFLSKKAVFLRVLLLIRLTHMSKKDKIVCIETSMTFPAMCRFWCCSTVACDKSDN